MRHSIINRRFINGHEWSIMVQLIPETPQERNAILHTGSGEGSERENKLIDKYLDTYLGLGRYKVIKIINRVSTTYTVQVYIE